MLFHSSRQEKERTAVRPHVEADAGIKAAAAGALMHHASAAAAVATHKPSLECTDTQCE